ncbi:TPA: hypothetical protein ACH1J3_004838 [Citrobacter werkmanii]
MPNLSVSATNISMNTSNSIGKSLLSIKRMNSANMLLSIQSQSIQNQGEIAGIKLKQQDALDTQKKNEDEYKKQQRHRILHAIVSVFAHVINLVMTIIRPVKHLAKTAKKALTKTLRKSINKASSGLLKNFGLSHPMKRVAGGVKKGLKVGAEKPGIARRALTHLAGRETKKFIKRTAFINGISGGLNGVGDGVFKIQTAKIKLAIDNLQNNIDLISSNFDLSESLKQQEQDNVKRQVESNIQMLENVNSAVNTMGNLQVQFLTKAV